MNSLVLPVIFSLGSIFLLYYAGVNRTKFYYLASFLIPFIGLGFVFFTNIWWSTAIFPISVVSIILFQKRSIKIRDVKYSSLFFGYILYVIFLTFIRAVFDYTAESPRYLRAVALGWGPAQSTFRYPVQLISFLFSWCIIFSAFWFVEGKKDLLAAVRGFIDSCYVNSIIGLYQVLAYQFRLPWPSTILFPEWTHEGMIIRMSMKLKGLPFSLYRLHGLGGEPKHIASMLVIGITLSLCLLIYFENAPSIPKLKQKLTFMLIALFFTFSSGGWVAMLVVFGYIFVSSFLHGRKKSIGAIVFVVMVVVLFSLLTGTLSTIKDLYDVRVSSRVSSDLDDISKSEPKDAAFLEYALKNPLNMIFGHGTGGIDFWIIDSKYLKSWNKRGTATVTPAYLPTRLLGDIGVVGIVFLLYIFSKWVALLKKRKLLVYAQFIVSVGIGLCFSTLVSLPAYFLLVGVIVAAVSRDRDMSRVLTIERKTACNTKYQDALQKN